MRIRQDENYGKLETSYYKQNIKNISFSDNNMYNISTFENALKYW